MPRMAATSVKVVRWAASRLLAARTANARTAINGR